MRKLNTREELFVREYAITFNGADAVRKAGYSCKDANKYAYKLLEKDHIQAALAKIMKRRTDKIEVTADNVLEEIRRVAFANAGDFFTWGPGGVVLKSSEDLGADKLACVSEASQTTTEHGGTVKIKLADKMKALEMLGRSLTMFTDKVVVDDLRDMSDEDLDAELSKYENPTDQDMQGD